MKKVIVRNYRSPVGELIIGSFNDQLCLCDWRYRKLRDQIDSRIKKGLDATFEEGSSEVIEETIKQLDAYFDKSSKTFDLPILFVGTEFQKSVWNALIDIAFGQTGTYLGLSKALGNEKAIRAVASANGANAISIIVPCHRIIGSDGALVGYAGGLSAKERLLQLEGGMNSHQLSLF
ncbi:MAG: methylated-DNA-[protein]-cysteine S-methyltransferase [Flavobacteriaceae bacterium]|jgi:methylated-DNA-[protein]-cysteine S-methyltransferase